MMSRHGPGFGLDDEVGLSQLLRGLPFVGVWPLPWTRHVFEITEGCAAVDPSNDGIDLRLAERHVILEFLDSHGGVNVPWRHLTGNHTLADRLRPRGVPLRKSPATSAPSTRCDGTPGTSLAESVPRLWQR